MSHLTPLYAWPLAGSLLAALAGAGVAIFAAIRSAREAGPQPPQSATSPFVMAALFAAMTGR